MLFWVIGHQPDFQRREEVTGKFQKIIDTPLQSSARKTKLGHA